MNKNIIINDADIIDEDIVEKFSIEKYCIQLGEGKYKIDFVGFVNNKNCMLVSFPKKYLVNDGVEDLKILGRLLNKYYLKSGPKYFDEVKNNFPLGAYLDIYIYYKKFGLYFEENCNYIEGYNGSINWKRTITNSNIIINNGNIIYNPFIIKSSENVSALITECMKFILNDGYNKFGKFFNLGVREKFNNKFNPKQSFDYVIDNLKKIKAKNFNDKIISLINSIINYFMWKSRVNNRSIFIIRKFNFLWEEIVKKYLNKNLKSIEDNGLHFKKNIKKYHFHKKEFFIGSYGISKKRTIEIDHFCKKNDKIIIFDSKYYNDIIELNYKQVSYQYFLMQKYPNIKSIVNGLILPNESSMQTKIHLDRKDIDDIIIMEYYLDINKLIIFFIEE